MSEDNNVIGFERRATHVRAMHMGYLITELDAPTLVRFICHIGETRDFLTRQEEHLTQMLGANFGLFRADAVTAEAPTTRGAGCP